MYQEYSAAQLYNQILFIFSIVDHQKMKGDDTLLRKLNSFKTEGQRLKMEFVKKKLLKLPPLFIFSIFFLSSVDPFCENPFSITSKGAEDQYNNLRELVQKKYMEKNGYSTVSLSKLFEGLFPATQITPAQA